MTGLPETTPPASEARRRQPRMPIDVRRAQVLDAALRLILRDGYAAATMEAIAREVQLAKPRVYSAYPGRGPLLAALLEREQQRMVATLAEAMPAFTEDGDVDTILATAMTNLLESATAHPDSWRLLMLATDDTPAEVRDHTAAGREFALQRLRALLDWGRDRRPGLAELDLEIAAQSLLAVGEHAVRLVLTRPEEFTPQRYARFTRSLLGLLPG
ncbi:TetR/AcrR family transcriptional regulator [Amycolatopsis sp. NBC_00345]|uniref:TetR/AcrR family transcriptional regulator n=1 Tax=Amycolatopsis sp. NBC_00345 TaxID=2975955 RepID=UPI002E25C403